MMANGEGEREAHGLIEPALNLKAAIGRGDEIMMPILPKDSSPWVCLSPDTYHNGGKAKRVQV